MVSGSTCRYGALNLRGQAALDKPNLQGNRVYMPPYKEPTLDDRRNAANTAKAKMLEKLRNKPPVDEALVAQQREARLAREAKAAEARIAKEAAKAAALAAKQAEAEAAAQAKVDQEAQVEMTDAERKAQRDARYAARKKRKGR